MLQSEGQLDLGFFQADIFPIASERRYWPKGQLDMFAVPARNSTVPPRPQYALASEMSSTADMEGSKEWTRRRVIMSKVNRSAGVVGGLALVLVAKTVVATPLGQGSDALIKANATMGSIELTHGCNRACRLGRVPRWGGAIRLHRHVGPNCIPVRC